MAVLLVSGSCGLLAGECVKQLSPMYDKVIGIDNFMREKIFNLPTIKYDFPSNYKHYQNDIRDFESLKQIFSEHKPDIIIHCAAQPSHDYYKIDPFIDCEINTIGTINMLELTKHMNKKPTFVYLSTTKVYGDYPNTIPLKETEFRYDYLDRKGLTEDIPVINHSHGTFGTSKLIADILVREYSRLYGFNAVCFRPGCITGSKHKACEAHGYMNYILQCAKTGKEYHIFGYEGKQTRDQIHVSDMARAIFEFIEDPKIAEVYNIGGGLENSVSILETIKMIEKRGLKLNYKYIDEPREGDHKCNIHDNSKFMKDFPNWKLNYSVDRIMDEILENI